MSLCAIIDALIASGCSPEQIGAAVRAHEAEAEGKQAERRAKAAARKAKWRASNVPDCPGDNAGHDGTERDSAGHSLPPKERSPTPPKEITPNPSSLRSVVTADANDPKTILGSVLSSETVVDLIAHRKALKAPFTAGAAKGLVSAFTAYGDPEAAARAMMANGWRGFRTDWMGQQPPARAGPSRLTGSAMLAEMCHLDDPDYASAPRTDPSHRPAQSPEPPDQSRRGFVGRLPFEDRAGDRRHKLVDH